VWVHEKDLGVVVSSHRQIVSAVAELLQPGRLAQIQQRAAAMKNRAVFEIPEIFEKILNDNPGVM